MRGADIARLIVLAAIWGSSFLFLRVIAPVLGPYATADARVLVAGLVLTGYAALRGPPLDLRRHGGYLAIVGVLNCAVPFLMYSHAALHIPASYSAILNATAPLFGMLLAPALLGERPSLVNAAGGVLGLAGVGGIAGLGPVEPTGEVLLAVGACLVATLCYAAAGIYMKRRAVKLSPLATAGASQLAAGLALLPLALASPPRAALTPTVAAAVLALSLGCSGIAFILYYQLLENCGPTRALGVTFLIPVFGVLWGALFLGESITPGMLGGGALVVVGTALVLHRRAAPSPLRAS